MHDLQLKRLRKQAGYATQADLAQRLGMNPRTYASWERGEVGVSLSDACRLADVLGCSLDELAGRPYFLHRFADGRQRKLNELFAQLDDSRKTFVVEAVCGLAESRTSSAEGADLMIS